MNKELRTQQAKDIAGYFWSRVKNNHLLDVPFRYHIDCFAMGDLPMQKDIDKLAHKIQIDFMDGHAELLDVYERMDSRYKS